MFRFLRYLIYMVLFLMMLTVGFVKASQAFAPAGMAASLPAADAPGPETNPASPVVTGETGFPATPSVSVEQPAPAVMVPSSGVVQGQHNVLVVGVDRIDSPTPRLVSLWLVLYRLDLPGLTLLPLYPLSLSGGARDAEIVSGFSLESSGQPGLAFLDRLHGMDLWWNHVMVVDELAIAAIVDMTGGSSLHGVPTNGAGTVAGMPTPWDDGPGALRNQVRLVQSLCQIAGRLPAELDMAAILNVLTGHLVSDFSPQQLIEHWKEMHKAGGQLCQFPTQQSLVPDSQ